MARRHGGALIAVMLLLVTAAAGRGASPTSTGRRRLRCLWRGARNLPRHPRRMAARPPSLPRRRRPRPPGCSDRRVRVKLSLEVAGVMGFAVSAVASDPATCIYETPDSHAIAALVQVATNDAAARFGALKGNPEATVVTGLGDEAVWLPAPRRSNCTSSRAPRCCRSRRERSAACRSTACRTTSRPDQLLDLAKKLGTIAVARL